MLILTRKSGEAIRIGDEVTLKIIEIRGNQVRLGVEAPRDLAVHREEIYSLIQSESTWGISPADEVHATLPPGAALTRHPADSKGAGEPSDR